MEIMKRLVQLKEDEGKCIVGFSESREADRILGR